MEPQPTMSSSSSAASLPSPPKDGDTTVGIDVSPTSSSPPSLPKDVVIQVDNIPSEGKNASTSGSTGNSKVVMEPEGKREDEELQQSLLSRLRESSRADDYGHLSRDVRVPIHEIVEEASDRSGAGTDQVLVCSSNSSLSQRSNLLRSRKSRWLDPPVETHVRSQTQKMGKSKLLGKGTSQTEDDPFLVKDPPEEDYKKIKYSILSAIQLLCLILMVAALVCTLTIKELKKQKAFLVELWRWEVLVLVVISGRLVSGWTTRVVVLLIKRNLTLWKRHLYFVYELKNSLQYCVWSALILIVWLCFLHNKYEKATYTEIFHYVTRIWLCPLVGSMIWLGKTLLVKVLVYTFHSRVFLDWIQESLINQYVIETLSRPALPETIPAEQPQSGPVEPHSGGEAEQPQSGPIEPHSGGEATVPVEQPQSGPVEPESRGETTIPAEPPQSAGEATILAEPHHVDHLCRFNQKDISAWNMKRWIKIVRRGMTSNLNMKIQRSTGDITSKNMAKSTVEEIFHHVAKSQSEYIYLEDLMHIMPKVEAVRTMRLLGVENEQKGISKHALENWVVSAFRDQRGLALTLSDIKGAIKGVHFLLNILVVYLILGVWLLLLNFAMIPLFVYLGSQITVLYTCFKQPTIDSIIFLFVMHPFDVGDRVEIEGVKMVVEKIEMVTTLFVDDDNQKIYYSNSVLFTKSINNGSRGPDLDAIHVLIDSSTSREKIAKLKEKMKNFVNNHSDDWYPAPKITRREMEGKKLKLSMQLVHRIKYQDMDERCANRDIIIEEMVKILRELDIEGDIS